MIRPANLAVPEGESNFSVGMGVSDAKVGME